MFIFFLLMFCYEWRYESLQVYFPVGNKYIKFLAPYYSWLGEVLNGTKLTWHIQYWWSQQNSIRLEKCKFKSWPISCISMEICQKNHFRKTLASDAGSCLLCLGWFGFVEHNHVAERFAIGPGGEYFKLKSIQNHLWS